MAKKKIAVILCGSGFKDGSEIRESVGVLWALSKYDSVEVKCFALDEPQHHVIDVLSGEEMPESRNQLVESARIARGDVQSLAKLDPGAFAALVIPGGFGAAKNLCDFAFRGATGSVHPLVQQTIAAFFENGKPIGAVCIAPMVVAMALPQKNLLLTLGAPSPAAEAAQSLGHRHQVATAAEICWDKEHNLVTTPAYMHDDAPLAKIFEGIDQLVNKVVQLS